MDRDEIKQSYSMRQVLDRYGLVPNRAGFICCPFHKEKTPSMKINKDLFYCFSCGEGGDIFSFIQKMDNLAFNEVYRLLGGTYDSDNKVGVRPKASTLKRIKDSKKRRHNRLRDKEIKLRQEKNIAMHIATLTSLMEKEEPFSELWCFCYNKLQYYLYLDEAMEGGEFTCGGWDITARVGVPCRHKY